MVRRQSARTGEQSLNEDMARASVMDMCRVGLEKHLVLQMKAATLDIVEQKCQNSGVTEAGDMAYHSEEAYDKYREEIQAVEHAKGKGKAKGKGNGMSTWTGFGSNWEPHLRRNVGAGQS